MTHEKICLKQQKHSALFSAGADHQIQDLDRGVFAWRKDSDGNRALRDIPGQQNYRAPSHLKPGQRRTAHPEAGEGHLHQGKRA